MSRGGEEVDERVWWLPGGGFTGREETQTQTQQTDVLLYEMWFGQRQCGVTVKGPQS